MRCPSQGYVPLHWSITSLSNNHKNTHTIYRQMMSVCFFSKPSLAQGKRSSFGRSEGYSPALPFIASPNACISCAESSPPATHCPRFFIPIHATEPPGHLLPLRVLPARSSRGQQQHCCSHQPPPADRVSPALKAMPNKQTVLACQDLACALPSPSMKWCVKALARNRAEFSAEVSSLLLIKASASWERQYPIIEWVVAVMLDVVSAFN